MRSCGVVMETASSKEGVNRLAIRLEVSRDGEARGSWRRSSLLPHDIHDTHDTHDLPEARSVDDDCIWLPGKRRPKKVAARVQWKA